MDLEGKEKAFEKLQRAFGDKFDPTKIVFKRGIYNYNKKYYYYIVDTFHEWYDDKLLVIDSSGEMKTFRESEVTVPKGINPVVDALQYLEKESDATK